MKKVLLFLSLVVFLSARGQNFLPLVDTNKLWSVANYDLFGPYIYVTRYYKFSGDTVINSVLYQKLWIKSDSSVNTPWYNSIFMREDGAGKVFYTLGSGEDLVYDFGASTGDTLFVGMPEYGGTCLIPLLVDSVDNVFFASQTRKRMFIVNALQNFPPYYIWIEGVGCLNGMTIPYICITDNGFDLLCYSENDTLKYSNPNAPYFNSCYYYNNTLGISEEGKENHLTIFPNPSSGIFAFSFSQKIMEIKITDVLGKDVFKSQLVSQKAEIDLSSRPRGIYFVKVTGEKGNTSVKKLVLQ